MDRWAGLWSLPLCLKTGKLNIHPHRNPEATVKESSERAACVGCCTCMGRRGMFSSHFQWDVILFVLTLLTRCELLSHSGVKSQTSPVSEDQKMEAEIPRLKFSETPVLTVPWKSGNNLRDFPEILPQNSRKYFQGELPSLKTRGLQKDRENNKMQNPTRKREEGPNQSHKEGKGLRKLLSLKRTEIWPQWKNRETVRKHKISSVNVNLTEYQKAVVDAFSHAWTGYKDFAWGHDELKPVSRSFTDVFGLGLTLIDALDTMWIMGLQKEFEEAKKWVSEKLHFDKDLQVNLFECTIRILGGLLSAYHLSRDSVFLEKAQDLGNRLMPAFSKSSKVPHSYVNLGTGEASSHDRVIPVAQVTSIQLEFRELSRLTGNETFYEAVKAVTEHIHSLSGKNDGLVPMYIDNVSGYFLSKAHLTVGANVDSYYEYLLKQWIQGGKKETQLLEDYMKAIEGMKRHLLQHSVAKGLTFMGEIADGKFNSKMDHFVCFLPGTLALGVHHGLTNDHMELAKALMKTCYQMYHQFKSGLSPEIVYFNINPKPFQQAMYVSPKDNLNVLRPETVESLFYLYRLSGDKIYQHWGWKILDSINKYTRVPSGGFTSIFNVRDPVKMDHMESFFLAETLKYMYLLFSDDTDVLNLDKYVFNTEAHPLPIWT